MASNSEVLIQDVSYARYNPKSNVTVQENMNFDIEACAPFLCASTVKAEPEYVPFLTAKTVSEKHVVEKSSLETEKEDEPPCITGQSHKKIKTSNTGEIVCTVCGMVFSEKCIDMAVEYRVYDAEQWKQKAHYGSPSNIALWDKGLSTRIDTSNRDCKGRPLQGQMRTTMRRLIKRDRILTVENRNYNNFTQAMNYLKRFKSLFSITDTFYREIIHCYRTEILHNPKMRGKNIKHTVLALMVLLSKSSEITTHTPILDTDIQETLHLSEEKTKQLRSAIHDMYFILKDHNCQVPIHRYITKVYHKMNIQNVQIQTLASRLINKCLAIDENFGNGNTPIGISAAAIFIASCILNCKINQVEFDKALDVAGVTIRNRKDDILTTIGIKQNVWRQLF